MTIFDDVADGRLDQARKTCILFAPLDHAFGRIDMAHAGSSRCSSHCRSSRVTEEVQHRDFTAFRFCSTNALAAPVPICSLLGEETCVFKSGGCDLESQIAIFHRPRLRHFFAVFPASSAFIAAVIPRIPARPLWPDARPNDLRIRPSQHKIPPTLQFHPVTSIEKFIVLPGIRKEGGRRRRGSHGD